MTFALALLLVVTTPQSSSKPVSPAAEVEVKSGVLELPGLPGSVAEARSGYRRVQREIIATMAELEQDMAHLCREADGDESRLLAGLRIPREGCTEARLLVGMLEDDAVQKANEAVEGSWTSWTTDLLRIGLNDPEGQIIISNWVRMPYLPHFVCPILFNRKDGLFGLVHYMDGEETKELHLQNLAIGSHQAIARVPYRKRSTLAKAALQVSEAYAPTLQGQWVVLRKEMSDSAEHWLNLEQGLQPTRNPDRLALRHQVKFQFLERYRSALWFCYIVWAHMASEALPPPLMKPDP
jgi:hypothetical protein